MRLIDQIYFCIQSVTNLISVQFSRGLLRETCVKKQLSTQIHKQVALQLVQIYKIRLFKMIILTFQIVL